MIAAVTRRNLFRLRPPAAHSPPDPAAAAPPDGVTLSVPSPEAQARALGWSALAASGALSASLVAGAVAVQLTEQQRAFLEEGLRSLQARGGKVLLEKGLLGSLLSMSYPYREVSPAEGLQALGHRQPLWVQPPGEPEPIPVETLDVLAAAEALALGAPPEQASAPYRVHSLLALEAAGYRFPKGALSAYQEDNPEVVGPDGRKQHLPGPWLSARAYFEVSHDRRTLRYPEMAEYLEANRELFGEPLQDAYARAHGWGAELSHQGIKLTELRTPTLEAATRAVGQAKLGRAILEQVFPEAQVLGEQELVGSIVRSVVREPAEVDPMQASRLLRQVARALPNPVQGYHIGELYEQEVRAGHRGRQLLERLELIAAVAHAVSFDELSASADFLKQSRVDWAGPYAALARPLGAGVARDLMAGLSGRPGTDFDLLAGLATAHALSGHPVRPELLLRDHDLLAIPEGKQALERAREQSTRDGQHALTTARAVALIRGVGSEELDTLVHRVKDFRLELPALLAGKRAEESAEQVLQRYRSLAARLVELKLGEQAPLAFPWLGEHQASFLQMAELLDRLGRGQELAREFIRLKTEAPDFDAALSSYLASLVVGGDGRHVLDPGASIAVESGTLRVGGTAIRVKVKAPA